MDLSKHGSRPRSVAASSPLDEAKKVLADLLPAMGSENLDERKRADLALQDRCFRAGRPGAEAERAALSRAIAERVGGKLPHAARIWLLKQLEHIGGAECVEALAGLLDATEPGIRERARRALQNNPAPEAGARLRVALARDAGPAWRVALINALGERREAAGIAALAACLEAREGEVLEAAAGALGKIGGPEAARALAGARKAKCPHLRAAVTDAYLRCAEGLLAAGRKDAAARIYRELRDRSEPDLVRNAALRGLEVVSKL